MFVAGLGDVTECNRSYVFIKEDSGEKSRIRSTWYMLEAILVRAVEDIKFYDRMWDEVNKLYEKNKAEADSKYHYITDEEVKEAYTRDRKEGFNLSLHQKSNNEEYVREWAKVHGLYGSANYALDRKYVAQKLKGQATEGLTKVKR